MSTRNIKNYRPYILLIGLATLAIATLISMYGGDPLDLETLFEFQPNH